MHELSFLGVSEGRINNIYVQRLFYLFVDVVLTPLNFSLYLTVQYKIYNMSDTTLMCLSTGIPKNNKFSICSKLLI